VINVRIIKPREDPNVRIKYPIVYVEIDGKYYSMDWTGGHKTIHKIHQKTIQHYIGIIADGKFAKSLLIRVERTSCFYIHSSMIEIPCSSGSWKFQRNMNLICDPYAR
jgi:hypothetical protein